MELIEDPALGQKMLEDLGKEIYIDKKLPHVTELIYCLTRSYLDRFAPLPPTPQETLLFVCGVGLEKVMLKLHRQHIEGEKDGINFDTDFLDYLDLPGELKTTRINEKNTDRWLSVTGVEERDKKSGEVYDIPDTWRKQILSYFTCNKSNVGTLGVLHLMGNYAPPFPSLRTWRVRASHEELEENWDWMLHRRDAYLAFVEEKRVPPQFVFNEKWECSRRGVNCKYKVYCDAEAAKGGQPC